MIAQIRDLMEKELKPLEEKTLAFPWGNRLAYGMWLAGTHRYVTHTVKLLQHAIDRLPEGEFRDCLVHHEDEEKGHEVMALRDLEALGYQLDELPELPTTTALYSTMYDLIDKDPAALMGYAIALENLSARCCPIMMKVIAKSFGENTGTFVELHGVVDQDHMQEGWETLKLLDQEQLKTVKEVMSLSIQMYEEFLDGILLKVDSEAA